MVEDSSPILCGPELVGAMSAHAAVCADADAGRTANHPVWLRSGCPDRAASGLAEASRSGSGGLVLQFRLGNPLRHQCDPPAEKTDVFSAWWPLPRQKIPTRRTRNQAKRMAWMVNEPIVPLSGSRGLWDIRDDIRYRWLGKNSLPVYGATITLIPRAQASFQRGR